MKIRMKICATWRSLLSARSEVSRQFFASNSFRRPSISGFDIRKFDHAGCRNVSQLRVPKHVLTTREFLEAEKSLIMQIIEIPRMNLEFVRIASQVLMKMMHLLEKSSSGGIPFTIISLTDNWFLMDKLDRSDEARESAREKEKLPQRKRQICHLTDMIECRFSKSFDSDSDSAREHPRTISLITLIDYNINCAALKWLLIAFLAFYSPLADDSWNFSFAAQFPIDQKNISQFVH